MNDYIKYPRTYHLPFSGGATDDDKTLTTQELYASPLAECEVVVTLKMDGEATSIYRDHCHARSLDSRHHPSRNWVKRVQGQIGYRIPEGWRVCGENCYAHHSIFYKDLPDYFLVYSIWDENNEALSWDDTVDLCEEWDLHHVPVLYEGPFDEEYLRNLADDLDPETQEGYVVRVAESFHYDDFGSCVAKYVSSEFKEMLNDSDEHWMHKEVVPNQLK